MKIIAMIPARIGSTRLKMKNLALINDKPLIYYAINNAFKSNLFSNIVVNSDSKIFYDLAIKYGAEFYHRNKSLGTSDTKSDDVVEDFMNAYSDGDIIVWLNPIAPFQTVKEIRGIITYLLMNNLDSLITVENKQVHCNYNGKPVNYNPNELFAQTQDIKPVQPFSYTIMMWKSISFLKQYKLKGHALFCGKFDVFPVSRLSSLIIKTEDDLKMADYIMRSFNETHKKYSVKYDSLANKVIGHEN